jgi:hypothetical protein
MLVNGIFMSAGIRRKLPRSVDRFGMPAAARQATPTSSLVEGRRGAYIRKPSPLAALQPEFARLLRSEDRQEYLRAHRENRPPVFVER